MERYSEEFKRDAVSLVKASLRPIAQIARELSVNDVTLRNWVRDARNNNKKAGFFPAQRMPRRPRFGI